MELQQRDHIGVLILNTPNNNAIDQNFISEAKRLLDEAEVNPSLKALVVTSTLPRIFCPGLNPMAIIKLSRNEITKFIEDLNSLYRKNFAFSKPIVAAVNGHAIGGGCLIAVGTDYRFMAKGKFQIGLREIDLGISIPIGTMAMLTYALGYRNVERVVYSGQSFSPEEALELGLVDELVEPEPLMERAMEKARFLASKPSQCFKMDKEYLKNATLEWMEAKDPQHLKEWVDCWFSEECQESVAKVVHQLTKK